MVIRKTRYAIFRTHYFCGQDVYVGWVEAIDMFRAVEVANKEFGSPKHGCFYIAQRWKYFRKKTFA